MKCLELYCDKTTVVNKTIRFKPLSQMGSSRGDLESTSVRYFWHTRHSRDVAFSHLVPTSLAKYFIEQTDRTD
jgi:hypothetical protein